MDRITLVINSENVHTVRPWLRHWEEQIAWRSADLGCADYFQVFEIEAPAQAIDELPGSAVFPDGAYRPPPEPTHPPDFEAHIRLLPADQGGRSMPVTSGYHPNHDLGLESLDSAQHRYPGDRWVRPGEETAAELRLLVPEVQAGRLHEGMEFTVQEGGRVVGRARITRVINPLLQT